MTKFDLDIRNLHILFKKESIFLEGIFFFKKGSDEHTVTLLENCKYNMNFMKY